MHAILENLVLPDPPAASTDPYDDASFEAWIAYQEAVGALIGATARWSAEAVDFRDVAHEGSWRVVYEPSEHWSARGSVVSAEMFDPTWLDLFRAADAAILASGDEHHVFIESFDPRGGMLHLATGS